MHISLRDTHHQDEAEMWQVVSGVRWKVGMMTLAVSFSLTAAVKWPEMDVCNPDADITSWRQMPYNSLHAFDGSLIRAEVKVEGTNYFTEYDDIFSTLKRTEIFLHHYFARGQNNTVFNYYTYYSSDAVSCASNPYMTKEDMRWFNYDNYLSIYDIRYVDGNESVRGIPVDHWQHCENNASTLDLYFPKTGMGAKFQLGTSPPMRIIERGTSIKTAMFDFVIDHRKMEDIESILSKAADGIDCIRRGWPTGVKENVPTQPRSYSATVVMVFAKQNHATTRELNYDSNTKLASTRVLILPGSDYMRRFGHGYLTIVTDYDDGLQYVIDVDQGNCTIETLSRRSSAFPFSGPWDPASFHSSTSPGLFDLSAFNLTYSVVYQRKIRDTTADVWVATRMNWPKPGVNSTVQVFFSSDWAMEGIDINEFIVKRKFGELFISTFYPKRMMGLAYHTTDEEKHLGKEIPEFTHVYDYRAVPPDFSVFDVSSCYTDPSQVATLTVSIRACYDVLVRHDPKLFEAALRKYIVDVCGITPIRVNTIEVDATDRGHVDVHIKLLDKPHVSGKAFSRSSVSLDDAVRRLGLAIDHQTDIDITVNYPEGSTKVGLIPGSLRMYGKTESSYEIGHTRGVVALVSCGMMLVGLMATPAAAYIIWKKNIAFPYFNQ